MFIPRRTREKARRTRRRLLFWNEAKQRTRRHHSVIRPIVATMSAGLLLAGCFAKIHELPAQPEHAEALFAPLSDQDFMVGLAVSGAGSRAATFAAGALEALAEGAVRLGTENRSALETVSYMSSVSGGSRATAYPVTS